MLTGLLWMIDAAPAARVRARLADAWPRGGNRLAGPDRPQHLALAYGSTLPQLLGELHGSATAWLLEADVPALNEALFVEARWLGDSIRRDLLAGHRFGPDRPRVLTRTVTRTPLMHRLGLPDPKRRVGELFDFPRHSTEQFVEQLREAGLRGSLRRCRLLAGAIPRTEWDAVAEADREAPLPGYARWALACHVSCPPELRAAFGSHPKFRNRLRDAGIVPDVATYLAAAPASRAAFVVDLLMADGGTSRAPEVRAELGPLVERHLGGNPDAWAVLARLLPDLKGTLAELITTAGAVGAAASGV